MVSKTLHTGSCYSAASYPLSTSATFILADAGLSSGLCMPCFLCCQNCPSLPVLTWLSLLLPWLTPLSSREWPSLTRPQPGLALGPSCRLPIHLPPFSACRSVWGRTHFWLVHSCLQHPALRLAHSRYHIGIWGLGEIAGGEGVLGIPRR